MSNRLDQDREQKLQPIRAERAIEKLESLGLTITYQDKTTIRFLLNGNIITFFPYSGWHTGKGIKEGRGFEKLFKQLKPNPNGRFQI